MVYTANWGIICYRSHLLGEPETTIQRAPKTDLNVQENPKMTPRAYPKHPKQHEPIMFQPFFKVMCKPFPKGTFIHRKPCVWKWLGFCFIGQWWKQKIKNLQNLVQGGGSPTSYKWRYNPLWFALLIGNRDYSPYKWSYGLTMVGAHLLGGGCFQTSFIFTMNLGGSWSTLAFICFHMIHLVKWSYNLWAPL